MVTTGIIERIMKELGLGEDAVRAVLNLLGKGATVPFIARYRKEQTGGLDEVQIRAIGDKFTYYAELEARKESIIKEIEAQSRMTPELKTKINSCAQKYLLEDIYLPYKLRERTAATIAAEKGLEPLADLIMAAQPREPSRAELAKRFVSAANSVATPEAAVAGALEIVIERIAHDADLRTRLRELYLAKGVLTSRATYAIAGEKTKYETYYNYAEPLLRAPSHRVLAIRRGAKEKVLAWEIAVPEDEVFRIMDARFVKEKRSVFHADLLQAIYTAYRRVLKTALEIEVFRMKLDGADGEAISVFAKNLRHLLLAPPAGQKVVMGVDPGIASGAKLAVVGKAGEFLGHRTVFLHGSARQRLEAEAAVVELAGKHAVELIAVGNGTASKETHLFLEGVVKARGLQATVLVTSEAGASVYSASDTARLEFPDLDITIRGAISIARRVQDPLADLVKIDPKSIGVGQYQHDVNQTELKKALDATVESCVNFVGVDLNSASAELLTRVAGLTPSLARGIVSFRKQRGVFREKRELLKVPLMNERVFEQCAGFLKIRDGLNPLDSSAIHPERYELVAKMAADIGMTPGSLIGNEEAAARLDLSRYVSAGTGLPTLEDIAAELAKPGRDPRQDFSTVEFSRTVHELADVKVGMVMNGVVTNVTNFGAFVDIGVHQDGLMHVSQMGSRHVKDPHEVVAAGDRVTVKVVSVDKALQRIGLAMQAEE